MLNYLSVAVGALSVISGHHQFFSPSSDYFRQSRVTFDFLGTCPTILMFGLLFLKTVLFVFLDWAQ